MNDTATTESAADVADGPSPAEEVRRLRATFATGRTKPLRWRLDQLRAIETMLTEGESAIAAALAEDLGRPANDTFLGDIAPTVAEAAFARKHLHQWVKPRRVGLPLSQFPGRAWYEYEPLGVTLVIGPWNYPVYLTIAPLVAAIAAGNCAVIKPSEHAPATATVIADLVGRYLDTDAMTVLQGGPAVTQEILAQGLDHAFFTGGTEVGKAVMAAAAPHLTPVTLELGGKCPALIASDADLDVAARRIAWTKLMNSGQTCIAPDYLLVDASVREEFLPKLANAFRELSPQGDGGRNMPIVTARHAERLAGLLGNHGGRVLLGGNATPAERKVDLTILVDPEPESPVMKEEIFGPILPVLSVESADVAMRTIGAGPKPLAAYVFSESKALQRRFRDTVSAGAVVANHAAMHVLAPELPFGGVGNSGMGTYHGKWGFETFSHRKAHLSRPTRPDLRIVYPPYNKLTQRLLRFIF
ncbi:aldehyde dehydrogenase family protein [Antrihabitans stalactiti]|uniref:Aldehyde dehydrogenase n=1 Tax=Antrihabitans stalactiti TaxID=2584121 RepID=A0A848K978_9NOCA|nr:aldehyde dehydrogenase family protein [Antrihabitans stalactiti]NMN93844.1 aldehyde dehydrogenase family protein [Antrihabitans stalactiti]